MHQRRGDLIFRRHGRSSRRVAVVGVVQRHALRLTARRVARVGLSLLLLLLLLGRAGVQLLLAEEAVAVGAGRRLDRDRAAVARNRRRRRRRRRLAVASLLLVVFFDGEGRCDARLLLDRVADDGGEQVAVLLRLTPIRFSVQFSIRLDAVTEPAFLS